MRGRKDVKTTLSKTTLSEDTSISGWERMGNTPSSKTHQDLERERTRERENERREIKVVVANIQIER
jgi:hypothetical protein